MTPIATLILLPVLCVVLFGSRRWALLGLLASVLFLTQGSRIDVFGVNVYAFRFVELAGFIRVLVRREFSFSRLNAIDRTLLLLYVYTTIIFLLRSNEGQVDRIGRSIDVLFAYFCCRGLITDLADLQRFLRDVLLLLIPFAVIVLIESFTTRNLIYSMISSDDPFWARDGRVRAFGSFRNPSLLGTVGASFLSFYMAMWFARNGRTIALVGIGCCLAIVWAANSGGPVGCVLVCFLGWALWAMRTNIRLLWRTFLVMLGFMALVMKAPVWYLLVRGSIMTGGSAWHRAHLLDQAFKNIDQWWLVGMPMSGTVDWFPYVLQHTGAADITNAYLEFGIAAGMPAMLLLIVLVVRSFRHIGSALSAFRLTGAKARELELHYWGIGVMLAVHAVNWLGIPYFDQFQVLWCMQFAVVSSLAGGFIRQPVSSGVRPLRRWPASAPRVGGFSKPEVVASRSMLAERQSRLRSQLRP